MEFKIPFTPKKSDSQGKPISILSEMRLPNLCQQSKVVLGFIYHDFVAFNLCLTLLAPCSAIMGQCEIRSKW